MYGFCGVFGDMVSIIPSGMIWYGMVWYGMLCKHKHEEHFGTFGSGLERLEMFWNCLNAFRALWDYMGAFGRLGRQRIIISYVCVVCK